MIKNDVLDAWISNHSSPPDCSRCGNLGWWKLVRIATVNARELDIHNKSSSYRVDPSPQVALLECSNCKGITHLDEDKLGL